MLIKGKKIVTNITKLFTNEHWSHHLHLQIIEMLQILKIFESLPEQARYKKESFSLLLFLKPVTGIARFLHSTQSWVLKQNSHWNTNIFIQWLPENQRFLCKSLPKGILCCPLLIPHLGSHFLFVMYLHLMHIFLIQDTVQL